jgi:hypothetical protein
MSMTHMNAGLMLGRQLSPMHLRYIWETPEATGIEFVNGDAPGVRLTSVTSKGTEAEAVVSRRDCCTTRTLRLTGRIEDDSHS